MTPDHWLVFQFDHAQPERQPDGSWVYESSGRNAWHVTPHATVIGGHAPDVIDFFPPAHYGHGFGTTVEPVGVPPLVNDSYGA
jgi:hypothetical protein